MKNTFLTITAAACMVLSAGCAATVKNYSVNYLKIYSAFPDHGTTNYIISAFTNPADNNVDTALNVHYSVSVEDFKNAIAAAKVKKHFQQKLGGITFAGEFLESGNRHYFAYFKSADLVIDFTDKLNYYLSGHLNLKYTE